MGKLYTEDGAVKVNEIATDADVEKLEKELEQAEKKARRRTIAGLSFSVVTFILGLVI